MKILSKEDIVKRVKKLNEKGESLESISRRLGVSYQTIHRWVHGKHLPSNAVQSIVNKLLKTF